METAQDILLDDSFDLAISSNGDFEVNASDMQHIILLIETSVGSWKQHPLIGVGIDSYLASSGKQNQLRTDIKVNLESDGYGNIDVLLASNENDSFVYNVNAKRLK